MLWTELSLSDSHNWSPNSQCDGIWRWSLWEVVRFKRVHENGTFTMGFKKRSKNLLLLSVCDHKGKSHSEMSTTDKPRKEASEWNPPWSWTSHLEELWETHFCCLNHLVYDILLWQPKLTKTLIKYLLSPNIMLNTRGTKMSRTQSLLSKAGNK